MADRFAARFAMRGASAASSRVPVTVEGVERLEDYGRLLRYLASIDIVETVQVERVEGTRIRFVLEAKGGRPALGRADRPRADPLAGGGRPRPGRRRGSFVRLPAAMSAGERPRRSAVTAGAPFRPAPDLAPGARRP